MRELCTSIYERRPGVSKGLYDYPSAYTGEGFQVYLWLLWAHWFANERVSIGYTDLHSHFGMKVPVNSISLLIQTLEIKTKQNNSRATPQTPKVCQVLNSEQKLLVIYP